MVCNDSQTCHLGNLLPIFDLLVPETEREGRNSSPTKIHPLLLAEKKLANGDPIYGWFLGVFHENKDTKNNQK